MSADPAEAAEGADLVMLAVPVMAMGEAAAAAAPGMKAGATLSDVGSVKGAVAEAMAANAPDGRLRDPRPSGGGHRALRARTPASRRCSRTAGSILTPQERSDAPYQAALERLTEFWMRLGSRVELMDARHHDLVLAVTSHLPHLIAYTIVGAAADLEEVTQGEVMKYSAGGFRDFTRIAASDPIMWRDVFLTNKDAVLEILGRFTEDLQACRAPSAGARARSCSSSSPAPGPSASASSPPARKAPSRTSGGISGSRGSATGATAGPTAPG